MSQPTSHSLFVSTPRGMEDLALAEATALGATDCRPTRAGVHVTATLPVAYALCLGARTVSRVLLPIATFEAHDTDSLYDQVITVPWEEHLRCDTTFALGITAIDAVLEHSRFALQRTKDAIVDRFYQRAGSRPNVDVDDPQIRVHVHLRGAEATLSIDLAGPLHRRGARVATGFAPLRETLAAAILMRCGWPKALPFADPMCGSGTLLIEAALMALNFAPGLLWATPTVVARSPGWLQHDLEAWQQALSEAEVLREAAFAKGVPPLQGSDADPRMVQWARDNIARVPGLQKFVRVVHADVANSKPLSQAGAGMVVTNPPYGERIGERAAMVALYARIGRALKNNYPGWGSHVFTDDLQLGRALGLRANRVHKLYNGALPCVLLHFAPQQDPVVGEFDSPASAGLKSGEAFANRLAKNYKRLKTWARKQQLQCYRVYDADIPEYAVAVDLYDRWVHVTEYAPPKEISVPRAEARLRDVLLHIPDVLGVPAGQVYLKVRQKQKGKSQYEKQGAVGRYHRVHEGDNTFWVNFTDYLDTGLFLDHRPLRRIIAQSAAGGAFLNLFAYTGTATVCAIRGGAVRTVTVDMSRTYLHWASQNLKANDMLAPEHALVQADCTAYLSTCEDSFDIILLDPPTFSNSKRMSSTLDIQRDHVPLIHDAMAVLKPSGKLYFSNNHRRFSLDAKALEKYQVKDITKQTIGEDFKRSPKIHSAFCITHKL